VIGSGETGFADIVCDGRNGRLVNIARPGDLRAALADYQTACLCAESTQALGDGAGIFLGDGGAALRRSAGENHLALGFTAVVKRTRRWTRCIP